MSPCRPQENGPRDCLLFLTASLPDGREGRPWQTEIVLRDHGGRTDIGYPRTTQRPDGKLLTVYYFHDQPKGDRCIAATIWEP